MQHVIDFLSAREMAELAQTCAPVRAVVTAQWRAQTRARFPYKRFSGRDCEAPDDDAARTFLLNLELRYADAPLYGRARYFKVNPGTISETGELSPSESDAMMIRGDLIIEAETFVEFIFDGQRCFAIQRDSFRHKRRRFLGKVFSIPLEFDIGYYGDACWHRIIFRIDKRVKLDNMIDSFGFPIGVSFKCEDKTCIIMTNELLGYGLEEIMADIAHCDQFMCKNYTQSKEIIYELVAFARTQKTISYTPMDELDQLLIGDDV